MTTTTESTTSTKATARVVAHIQQAAITRLGVKECNDNDTKV